MGWKRGKILKIARPELPNCWKLTPGKAQREAIGFCVATRKERPTSRAPGNNESAEGIMYETKGR